MATQNQKSATAIKVLWKGMLKNAFIDVPGKNKNKVYTSSTGGSIYNPATIGDLLQNGRFKAKNGDIIYIQDSTGKFVPQNSSTAPQQIGAKAVTSPIGRQNITNIARIGGNTFKLGNQNYNGRVFHKNGRFYTSNFPNAKELIIQKKQHNLSLGGGGGDSGNNRPVNSNNIAAAIKACLAEGNNSFMECLQKVLADISEKQLNKVRLNESMNKFNVNGSMIKGIREQVEHLCAAQTQKNSAEIERLEAENNSIKQMMTTGFSANFNQNLRNKAQAIINARGAAKANANEQQRRLLNEEAATAGGGGGNTKVNIARLNKLKSFTHEGKKYTVVSRNVNSLNIVKNGEENANSFSLNNFETNFSNTSNAVYNNNNQTTQTARKKNYNSKNIRNIEEWAQLQKNNFVDGKKILSKKKDGKEVKFIFEKSDGGRSAATPFKLIKKIATY